MGCTSTMKARCGSGPMTGRMAGILSTCCAGCASRSQPASGSCSGMARPIIVPSRSGPPRVAWASICCHCPATVLDLMAVEPLWRWLREDVTYHHCHATAEDLIRRVAAFEADVNADPCAVADRLWVKDHLDPEEEKLRFSK